MEVLVDLLDFLEEEAFVEDAFVEGALEDEASLLGCLDFDDLCRLGQFGSLQLLDFRPSLSVL